MRRGNGTKGEGPGFSVSLTHARKTSVATFQVLLLTMLDRHPILHYHPHQVCKYSNQCPLHTSCHIQIKITNTRSFNSHINLLLGITVHQHDFNYNYV